MFNVKNIPVWEFEILISSQKISNIVCVCGALRGFVMLVQTTLEIRGGSTLY
jgi:hypothetical protein